MILILSWFLSLSLCSDIIKISLEVNYIWMTVEGFEKAVIAVNGSRIGPVIRANEGDTLQIHVYNHLFKEVITIHWHGIHMKGTPYMDGVPFVTQCPINPSDDMIYEFTVDQSGTYWYHAHVETQRDDAFYGALIVDPIEPYSFPHDEEKIIFLSDFYHSSGNVQMLMLKSVPNRWTGDPQNFLFNGAVSYNWTVQHNKIYLVRLISASAMSWYNISIPNHSMTIVEIESTMIEPFETPSIWINSGERYTFLLHTKHPGCYKIGFTMLSGEYPLGTAFLKYEGMNCDDNNATYIYYTVNKTFNTNMLRSKVDQNISNATRNLTIDVRQIINPDRTIIWTFNNASYMAMKTPFLEAYYSGQVELSDNESSIIMIEENDVIDITFTNSQNPGTSTVQHPLHIHGHSYWILATGLNDNPIRELNIINPVKRDTFTLPYNGWVTIRLIADNPGAWLLHCHISWHMIMGMSLLFLYPKYTIPKPPKNLPKCVDIEFNDYRVEKLYIVAAGLSLLSLILLTIIIILLTRRKKIDDEYPLLTDKVEIYSDQPKKTK